jgi:hypothetical protein
MRTHRPHPFLRATSVALGVAVCATAILLVAPPSRAQTAPAPSRGQLLYATHCVACHDTHKHWRDQRVVRDWAGLLGQVRHWQRTEHLQWDDTDIEEVARYLNDRFYKLPKSFPQQGRRLATEATRG